jgi:hypothetical protein
MTSLDESERFMIDVDFFFIRFRFVTEEKVLEIEVEPGVYDGYEIPFRAEGERNTPIENV